MICARMAAQYTFISTPRFHITEHGAGLKDGPIKAALDKVASMIDGQANVKLDLLHPIYEKTNDPSLDLTIGILESCTNGWQCDGDNPRSIYFATSASKRMLDIGTIPKGKNIPFMDQLPAFAVFDSHEQYYVTTAIATQQEKGYQDRQNGKLQELEVTARFVPDRRTLHPDNKAPQEYFMLINTSSVGPDVDYLLPRTGDSADVVLLGIFTTPQKATEDMGDVDNDHISMHIKESIEDVLDDAGIESKSESDDRIYDLLKVLCVRDYQGNEIAANLENLRSNLETIQELANDDEEQLLDFVRSNRTWLDPPPPEMDENNPFGEPVRLRGHRINVPSKLWPAQTHVWKLRVPVDKSTGNAKLPLILDLPDPNADDSVNPLKSIRGFTDQ